MGGNNNIATLYEQPTAVDAEQALIGACLMDARAFDISSEIVTPDDFSEDVHAVIWDALTKGRGAGRSTNFRLVAAALGDAGHKDLGNGQTVNQYLARLAADASSISDAPHFARAVKDVADVRRLMNVATDINTLCREGLTADAESIASEAIQALDDVAQSRAKTHTPRVSIGKALDSALEQALVSKGQKVRGLSWGLESIDRLTLGLRPSHLYIIGGRPGMGKTMLAISTALAVARAGYGAYFVSLEMSETELAERACSAEAERLGARVTYQQLATLDIGDHELPAIQEAQARIREMPIEIEQQPGVTLGQIRTRARQVKNHFARRGIKLGAIFIDHLGLIRADNRYRGNKYAETTEISNGLKIMAKDFGVPLIALAQLNRQVEGRDDKRAGLGDMRDSGSLEQDADCVIFPFREAYYLKKQKDLSSEDIERLAKVEHIMEIAIAKQRNGPEGHVECFCLPGCNVVRDLERRA